MKMCATLPGSAPWESWNIQVFQELHATHASPAGLISAAAWAAELPLDLAFALTAIWIIRNKDRRAGAWILFALVIAVLFEFTVASVAFHPRPFAAGFGPAWVHHDPNNSMPSTHVMLTWTMALVALFRHRTLVSLTLFALGALMAWARIYVGIHWPADMVGAFVAASISATLAWIGLKVATDLRRFTNQL